MRIRNSIEHDREIIGPPFDDLLDAPQTFRRHDFAERRDHLLGRPLQRGRAFDFDDIWVVRSHLLCGLLRVDRHAHDERAALIALAVMAVLAVAWWFWKKHRKGSDIETIVPELPPLIVTVPMVGSTCVVAVSLGIGPSPKIPR